MVQAYTPKELNKKNNKKKSFETFEEQSEASKDFLKIWRANPSFEDINKARSIAKIISLLVLVLIFIVSLYISSNNLLASVISGFIFLFVFICVFHDGFFSLHMLLSKLFRRVVVFDPFDSYIFWFNNDDRLTLYIHNKNDLTTIATRIYSIEMIPENVSPNVGGFIKSLSIKDIRLSYSYQVVQKPIINLFDKNITSQEALNSYTSTIGKIFFTVTCSISGIISNNKIEKLQYFINLYSSDLKSNIVTNFHHFKAKLLSDEDLLNAIRLLYTGVDSKEKEKKKRISIKNSIKKIYIKSFVVVFLLISTGWIFSQIIVINSIYVLLIEVSLALFIIFVWWRSVLFEISRRTLIKKAGIDFLNPFKNVKFYTLRRFPFSLFMYIDNRLLIGMKIVNLKHIYNSTYCRLDRFIEALNNHKIHFTYTLKNEPLYYYSFKKYGLRSVYDNVRHTIMFHPYFKIENDIDEERWLSYRRGMWYSFLTISVNKYEFTDSIDNENFEKIEEGLNTQLNMLKGAFRSNFHSYELEDLRSNRLLSGFLFSVFKDNKIRLNGSRLSYLMLQGTTLAPLSEPVHILRRAINSRLPAEFNTPLHLRNYITIGYTINTEVFEQEVPVGFLYEQIKNLLITNGNSQSRELTAMKIVSELVQQGKPSLIFDFTGTWTKIFSLLEDSQYMDDIYHFRLGAAFTTNPLVSDIPYDTHNTEYIEYMLDAFALAFKKDQRTIDMFRSVISKNPEMDLTSMQLEVQTQNDWQKSSLSYSLQDLFSDLTPQDRTFFQDLQGPNKILAHDFVCNDKTIIVDLSILKDLNKKLFFTFLILSKIIHYIKYKEDYFTKIIVIPHIDLYFEQRFLDTRMNYGKINSFFDPLVMSGFGLLFSANQVNYLHPNIHTYFNNIISFRATDNKDVSILKSLLRLHETPGTGEYSNKRRKKYQLEYLKSLNHNNALIRRDDIYQSFPVKINWNDIKNSQPYTYEKLLEFMDTQGFNLRSTEQSILNGAMSTIFEKDLGSYFFYINEIINFMKSIKSVDRVGNLYIDTIKKELLKWLYPKLSKKTNNKEHMKKVRDHICSKLIKHEYLVEDHPKRASGSESLATSYKVGDQYEKALNDYFRMKGKSPNIKIEEVIEELGEELIKEGEDEIFHTQQRKYIIRQEDVYEALAREFSDFTYEMSKLFKFMKNNNYSHAIKIEQIIIKKFFFNVYRHYYNIDRVVMPSEVLPFFKILENTEGFPFTAQELKSYLAKYQEINLDIDDPEIVAHKMYNTIHRFFIKIQNYLYQE